ncbi:heparinase II/III family protein [Paenibacillus sp. MY03]|uniref:heparinase II/III domain-containing protein n=1 Tax=Paenibacillus sp. MY03 TaxID=302980 RepID=UPI0015C59D12|nr:heparinase II/III family protein [Paenibacillus sp. MY03]
MASSIRSELWLPPEEIVPDLSLIHPRVFYSQETIASYQEALKQEAPSNDRYSRRSLAAKLAEQADALHFMALKDEEIFRLLPAPYSYYWYGVTNPVAPDGTRVHPIGWDSPGKVISEAGHTYPNESYPDEGEGWEDPQGRRYYFVGRWNGFVVDEMSKALEKLAYAYIATGDMRYARKAAVLFDGLASIYPTATEGPLDYPECAPGLEGGRLERPLYQVARTMLWFVNAADLIWSSGALDAPSVAFPGYTIKVNLVYNLLLNGADYCYRESHRPGYFDQLHNGTADYNLGLLAVGSLLGIETYASWMLDGPTSIRYMLANNVDRDGNYFETSALYGRWTQGLYMHAADMLYELRIPKYPNGVNLFDDARFARCYVGLADKNAIAGRAPAYGDSPVDDRIESGLGFDPLEAEWIYRFCLRAGSDEQRVKYRRVFAELMSRRVGVPVLDDSAWAILNDVRLQGEEDLSESPRSAVSDVLGGKGLAYLRSKRADRGAVLRYGPTLNHGHTDELAIMLYGDGRELSFDPGYGMSHYRSGWQFQTISHVTVAVNGVSQLDAKSAGGSLRSFGAFSEMSFAEASDEAAYANESVREYRRLLAMVDLPGGDGYFVDLFRVEGGHMRDYSFHGKGVAFRSEGLQLSDSRPGSLGGESMDWGRIYGDGRVEALSDQSFDYVPPGHGYGFLMKPRSAKPEGAWSAEWSNPGRLKLTMLPAVGREIIVLDGPSVMGVQYAIARDEGDAARPFVSVIEAGENREPVTVSPLSVKEQETFPSNVAFSVSSGTSVVDYWLSAKEKEIHAADPASGIAISSDAELARVSIDAEGNIRSAQMAKGTSLRFGSFVLIAAHAELKGTITAVDAERGEIRMERSWEEEAEVAGALCLIDSPSYSHNSPYRISSCLTDGRDAIIGLDPGDLLLASGKLRERPEGGDLPNGVNLPFSRNVRRLGPNAYFKGKRVENDDGAAATIRAVQSDYAGIEVDDASGFREGDYIRIVDTQAGDELSIPVTVDLTRLACGDYELRSPIAVCLSSRGDRPIEVWNGEKWRPAAREAGYPAVPLYRIEPMEGGIVTLRM